MSRSRTGIPPIHSNKVGGLGSVMEGYHSDRWLLPNGSRISCGRNARRRKAAERQTQRLAGEAAQLLLTCERPPASSACQAADVPAAGSHPELAEMMIKMLVQHHAPVSPGNSAKDTARWPVRRRSPISKAVNQGA